VNIEGRVVCVFITMWGSSWSWWYGC